MKSQRWNLLYSLFVLLPHVQFSTSSKSSTTSSKTAMNKNSSIIQDQTNNLLPHTPDDDDDDDMKACGAAQALNNHILDSTSMSGGYAISKIKGMKTFEQRGWRRGGSSIRNDDNEEESPPMGRVRSRLMAASSIPNDALTATSFKSDGMTNHNSASTINDKIRKGPPMKILFLSSDTGGGHRASAESLGKQFEKHYPGSTYDLVDLWTKDGCLPYRSLVSSYKHLSASPNQWRFLYHFTNTSPYLFLTDTHSWLLCERKIRKTIESYNPDVIVSVHPTMQNVPLISTRKIAKKLGKLIPFITVVTDFGSGHCHWFHRGVDKVYVASDRIRRLARRRGRVRNDRLIQIGLPIRVDFPIQVEAMGDRTSEKGKRYQMNLRNQLGITHPTKKMVLVMGGGEGVGSLSRIAEALYATFTKEGVDATIVVVCGRNENLKKELNEKDWKKLLADKQNSSKRNKRRFNFRGRAKPGSRIRQSLQNYEERESRKREGDVDVVGLGFVTNMAEYMVATDVLVSKAGPGTIAEAASVGLPVMLTSYLPGQEAGNIDIVLDGGFGDYCSDPDGIAEEVACWLQDEPLLEIMSKAATAVGAPNAASDIVLSIGDFAEDCMEKNRQKK